MATSEDRRATDSGIEIEPVYTAEDVAGLELEPPGEYPFTRGPYATMYRGRPWTIRQYAGFGSAEETNERFRYLLDRGQTGLSIAFDLPTQLGYDSDDPLASGEVGRTGVAIDSIEDMRTVLEGIPLDRVSTSMTINAPATLLLLLYELVAEEQRVPGAQLRGTVQNDILKEYIARGNYIFPPRPSMRITTDLFSYCADRLPSWNTISISGYHIREPALRGGGVALGAHPPCARELAALDLRIDALELDLAGLVLGERVHPDDHPLAGLDLARVPEGGLLDLVLHEALLDRGHGTPELLDPVDQLERTLLDLHRERLDEVRAAERVGRIRGARLELEYLLRPERDPRRPLRR